MALPPMGTNFNFLDPNHNFLIYLVQIYRSNSNLEIFDLNHSDNL